MNNKIKIKFNNLKQVEVAYKTKAVDALKLVESDISDILALRINNEVRNYDYELVKDSTIEYIRYADDDGYRIYSRTLKMILYMALTKLYSNAEVEFISTINKDQYFIIKNVEITDDKLQKIKKKM
ncbi:MAG: hypothetical protein RSA08_01410, partial [Clostridia bacterium]